MAAMTSARRRFTRGSSITLGVQGRNRILFEPPSLAGRLIADINLYAALSATLDLKGPGATTRIN